MPTLTGRLTKSNTASLASKTARIYRKEKPGSVSTDYVTVDTDGSGNFSISLDPGRYEFWYNSDIVPFTLSTSNARLTDVID